MEWISKVWDFLLDATLGKSRDEKTASLLENAERNIFSNGNVTAIFSYRDPAVRKALWLFKYRGNKAVAESCANALWEMMIEEISEESLLGGAERILLVPIPSSKGKKRKKGFNQTQILCKAILKKDTSHALDYSENVLYKVKDTEAQATLKDRRRRLENLKDTMQAIPKNACGKTIFLVDDITTTGATFKEATRALRIAGAKKILCFAVAH